MQESIYKIIKESSDNFNNISNDKNITSEIEKIIDLIVNAFLNDNKLLLCGNGGSAGDSQHLAAELIGRYKKDRRPLKSLALTTDSSAITCIANDYSYEKIFERQIEGLGVNGDALIGITTSGNSANVINALSKCSEIGVTSICLLGKDGGVAKSVADHSIIVESDSTARIQEMHIMIGQIFCDLIEHGLSLK